MFQLKHTFDEDYGIDKATTNNLMDYADGTILFKQQWDAMYDEQALLFAWLQDEEEGKFHIVDDLIAYIYHVLDIAPAQYAKSYYEYLVYKRNGGKDKPFDDYYLNIEGIYLEDQGVLGNSYFFELILDIYGIEVDCALSGHRKINKELMRVEGINFDKGILGKGVSGGGMRAISGFLIQFYNEDNKVLNLLIIDEKKFDNIESIYDSKYNKKLYEYLEKDEQTKDFYKLDQAYNKVMHLYNKDPYSEEYKAERKKYDEIRKKYYQKYK
jgi:hypothetical protein